MNQKQKTIGSWIGNPHEKQNLKAVIYRLRLGCQYPSTELLFIESQNEVE